MKGSRALAWSAMLLLACLGAESRAERNLVLACANASAAGAPVKGSCDWYWMKPENDRVVASCSPACTDYYAGTFRRWQDIPATDRVWACSSDIQVNTDTWCEPSGYVLKSSLIQPGTGTGTVRDVTLTWTPPTRNADGTPLGDLAGYRIAHGTRSGSYTENATVGLASSYVWRSLPEGTHYFVAFARDTRGNESVASNETTIVIGSAPPPPPPPSPETWVVAPNASNTTRTAYEAVLNVSGVGYKRGGTEGSIAVGRPCGSELFRTTAGSWRTVSERDIALSSPTYRGRSHVAICVRQ
jgi:hypothetical protein